MGVLSMGKTCNIGENIIGNVMNFLLKQINQVTVY